MTKNSNITNSRQSKIACPTCQKQIIWSPENRFRPFCSERCKLIDLGEWAAGTYAIPQKHSEEDEVFSSMIEETQDSSML
ncbi:DNA gyrase inhibitor YacG [Marinomonas agarivorans]|nr:DNA gyrase inhibitor YacG [Marinomonas agarivorans]